VRDQFDIPPDVAYLNCSFLAPQLRSVTEVGLEAVARKARPWDVTAADFFTETEELRAAAAAVMGVGADHVAIVPSVSYGMAVAAANLAAPAGKCVLVLAEQFPSNVYPWRETAEIRVVARPADGDWTAAVLAALDAAVAVVAVPQAHWTDGSLLDLTAVGEAARGLGAALVVDASQSLGAAPLDVGAIRPDFLVAVGYKWLLGPYSLGYLYADERHWDGRPIEHNWINREASDDFSRLVDYRDRYQAGARRYDVGERSNFVLNPMGLAALRQVLAWGVDRVAHDAGQLTKLIAEEAHALGFESAPGHLRVDHMLGLRRPQGLPPDLPAALQAAAVHVSVRGDSIRVSPYLYNTEDDVDRLIAVLADAR
jgi:selenocysteine lyase/cysteine desulfurase